MAWCNMPAEMASCHVHCCHIGAFSLVAVLNDLMSAGTQLALFLLSITKLCELECSARGNQMSWLKVWIIEAPILPIQKIFKLWLWHRSMLCEFFLTAEEKGKEEEGTRMSWDRAWLYGAAVQSLPVHVCLWWWAGSGGTGSTQYASKFFFFCKTC